NNIMEGTTLFPEEESSIDIQAKEDYNPDPYGRAQQKKQGRELKNKARKGNKWEPRNNKRDGKPAKPKSHTPGKDHRKHFTTEKFAKIF
ncbi:MAG: hypothetical protein J6S14_14735, partial [Clostridia bacterium]|nr:hypothetical protein [Clostridia bacterium]